MKMSYKSEIWLDRLSKTWSRLSGNTFKANVYLKLVEKEIKFLQTNSF